MDVFFEQNSLEYAFIQQEDEELINWFDKSCSAFEANCYDFENVIGRSPTKEAVQYMRDTASTIVTITRQWVLSQIKKTTTRTTSKFILLRENAVSMWAMRDKKYFIYDHVSAERRKVSFPTSPTAREFQLFAAVLLMEYEGPSMETAGSTSSTFQFSDREIPRFPSKAFVFERETFWRWQSTDACSDLITASVEQLFVSLLFAASGTPVECTKIILEKFLRAMGNLLRYRCHKQVTYESGLKSCVR